MAVAMWATGKKDSRMGKELSIGLVGPFTLATGSMVKEKGEGDSY